MKLPVDYDGLTPGARKVVREEYVRRQSGLCHHCGAPLDGPAAGLAGSAPIKLSLFPPGFFDHPVHLHHSHDTGKTIGAVHAACNAFLWQYLGE